MSKSTKNWDILAIRNLELCQELIQVKVNLEQVMREGFFLMAKSRYSNGAQAVTLTKVPNDDPGFESNVKVYSKECLRNDCNVRFNHYSFHDDEVQDNWNETF